MTATFLFVPLAAGTHLGPYEIVAPIGAGGMGEVYKAKDTRLDRTVAIKVLPEHLASSPELRQRFEQEARAVSSLNHPHICTLHDIGSESGTDFLVMEFLEGETLADRLERGPMPWQEAVQRAIELADALDKAHRAGVVHRDLKPGNIVLGKSGVKLLDFGLAKLHTDGTPGLDLSGVTEARPLTEKGAILGTFQYMSPEQLEGKDADARTDLFSLGAVIYEMVTGEKAFHGESQASLIAAIMSGSPRPMSETGAVSAAGLHRVIEACLEKSPELRWQSAADLRRNLEWLQSAEPRPTESGSSFPRRSLLTGILGAAAGILLATLAVMSFTGTGAEPRTPMHFQIAIGENEGTEPGVEAHVAVSPGGSMLAYSSVRNGTSRLYLRRLDESDAVEVANSEGANWPSFSPDGEWVVFQAYPSERKLKKVSIYGGAPQTLHDNRLSLGATWLADDTIVFGDWPDTPGLFRVSASGGASKPVLLISEAARDGTVVLGPERLPVEESILLTSTTPQGSNAVWLSLDTSEELTVLENAVQARYVPTEHLLFVRGGALWAVPFDLDRRRTTGTERPVVSGLQQKGTASFSVSDSGTLVYVPGEEGAWVEERLSWLSRSGERRLATGERHDFQWPRISPTGRNAAMHTEDSFHDFSQSVWILDIDSQRLDRLTFRVGHDRQPVWTSDGQAIFFASDRGGEVVDLYRQPVEPLAEAELLLSLEQDLSPFDVSPDGRVLAFGKEGDIHVLSLEDGSVAPFVDSGALEELASFSPDGRFVAYISDESGQREVYVQPYPPSGGKVQISRNGATAPVWSGDGRELFYMRDGTTMAVEVRLSPRFEVLGERELFEAPINRGRNFDVHPTTGEFLFVDKTIENPPQYVNVITNFFEVLRKME